jgi:hypothetical protein
MEASSAVSISEKLRVEASSLRLRKNYSKQCKKFNIIIIHFLARIYNLYYHVVLNTKRLKNRLEKDEIAYWIQGQLRYVNTMFCLYTHQAE